MPVPDFGACGCTLLVRIEEDGESVFHLTPAQARELIDFLEPHAAPRPSAAGGGDAPAADLDPALVAALNRAADIALDQIFDAVHVTRHREPMVTVADLLAAMRVLVDPAACQHPGGRSLRESAYGRLLARLGLDWGSDA